MSKLRPTVHASEFSIHCAVADFLRAVLDPAHARFHHSPNQGNYNKRRGGMLKRMGVMAGWPDFVIIYRGRTVRSLLFIELKKPRETLNPNQSDFCDWCTDNGFIFLTCGSVDQVEKALRLWGVPTRLARAA